MLTPEGITYDGNGNLYVTDATTDVRKIVIASASVTTFAGIGGVGGSADGVGTAARFNYPLGIAYDGNGNLYVSDHNNDEIRKIVVSSASVTTFAGNLTCGNLDGTGTAARFCLPSGVAADSNGNVYVADFGNSEIRNIAPIPTALNNFSTTSSFVSVYPNPASQILYVKFSQHVQATTLKIMDMIGKEIQSVQQSNTELLNIDISNLAQGLYFIQVITPNGTEVHKFIKE